MNRNKDGNMHRNSHRHRHRHNHNINININTGAKRVRIMEIKERKNNQYHRFFANKQKCQIII